MALHADVLAENLLNLLADGADTLAQALVCGPARPLVRAYDGYAKDAQDLGFNPTMMTGTIAMQAALQHAVAEALPAPQGVAHRLQAAHKAYWEATTFATTFKPTHPEGRVVGGTGRFRAIVVSRVYVGDTAFFAEEVARIFTEPRLDDLDRAVMLAEAWHRATGHVWTEMSGLDTTFPQERSQTVRAWGCIR